MARLEYSQDDARDGVTGASACSAYSTVSDDRAEYKKPTLALFGDLRSVTLGGTVGSGDSSGVAQERLSFYGDFDSIP